MNKDTLRIAASDRFGDGISPEVGLPSQKLIEIARGHGLEMDLVTHPWGTAEYYLTQNPHEAWPEGTPDYLWSNFNAFYQIALGVRLEDGRNFMDHAMEIIIKTGRQDFFTHVNVRPVELVHPSLARVPRSESQAFVPFVLNERGEKSKLSLTQKDDSKVELVLTRFDSSAVRQCIVEAVEEAIALGLSEVGVLTKSNIIKNTHGKWPKIIKEVQAEYPGIKISEFLMDSFCERLVRDPGSVPEVLVTDSMFGSILNPAIMALEGTSRGAVPEDFELTILRENIEGAYYRGGLRAIADYDQEIAVHSERLVRLHVHECCRLAKLAGRNSITLISYANHLSEFERVNSLWRRLALQAAAAFDLSLSELSAGDFIRLAAIDPAELNHRHFIADNLIGDICGDAAAGLVGGLGIPATASYNFLGTRGPENATLQRILERERKTLHELGSTTTTPVVPPRMSFFEPLGGSAPDIAGKGIANPTAAFLTIAEMFQTIGHPELKEFVRRAIHQAIDSGIKTQDIGGTATTSEFSDAVLLAFDFLVQRQRTQSAPQSR